MKPAVDEGFRYLAAKYLRKQAKQLAAQIEGIRQAEDIEYVHRARVASRRLRAALRVFRDCFRRKTWKRWRKHVRRVTVELGLARDRDVQIEYLCGILRDLDQAACYPAICRLLAQTEEQREVLQPEVVKAVDRLIDSGVLDEMQAEAKDFVTEAKRLELSPQTPAAYRELEGHAVRRLRKLLGFQACLLRPEDQEAHHAMRIAAKRLRYTLEIAGTVFKDELSASIQAVRRVQTLLGDIHDCDVWLAHLDAFAEAEREKIRSRFGSDAPFARLETGIEYLRDERRTCRRRAFRELVEKWDELSREAAWEGLVAVLARRAESQLGGDRSSEEQRILVCQLAAQWRQFEATARRLGAPERAQHEPPGANGDERVADEKVLVR
jgi:CHAD domain-containing protein